MLPKAKSISSGEIRTIEILTKLLAISMVANSFLGLSTILAIRLLAELWSSFSSSISVGESENKATSEPEMIAEQSSSKQKIANCTISAISTVKKGISNDAERGSVSKIKEFRYTLKRHSISI